MPSDREPLKILKAEVYTTRDQRPDAETYIVHLALNRALTQFERDVINSGVVDRLSYGHVSGYMWLCASVGVGVSW